jgi:23S rRNA (guanosine2251-2'-O)-methyltransferase
MQSDYSKKAYVILHDIRSAENVGSIFRTADAAGVSGIFLTGYTPGPVDRFGRKDKKVTKAALGAEQTVTWEKKEKIEDVFARLRKEGVQIVAVEQAVGAVDYKDFSSSFPTAFVFGNEVDGVPSSVLAECDAVIDVPMRGIKESLNVSVCAGIVLFRMLDTPNA